MALRSTRMHARCSRQCHKGGEIELNSPRQRRGDHTRCKSGNQTISLQCELACAGKPNTKQMHSPIQVKAGLA
uniref:Uncharacterized protein n=1 Tax=Arundo donax TaxID=35708 RepID=A0A0A8YIP2_ARUDO